MTYRLSLVLSLLGGLMLLNAANLSAMPSPVENDRTPFVTEDSAAARTRLAQAQTPQAPAAPNSAATPAQTAADEPIGNVATLTGSANVIRNNASTPLKLKDDIFFNDTVLTGANAKLGITFNDATTFNLSANSKMTIDNYVYEEGGSKNAGVFDIAKGTVAFVAAAVAKTGDMKITTPTATLGIRGTTGLVEVPENAATANNVAIKLYPDPDGRVGRIEVNDRMGTRLGALTQGASGFAIRAGMGGASRFAAVPLAISPREVLRDQGFVRQVHAAQSVGRQIVTEQRAFRRANPGLNNNRGNQPGQQRPNGVPGQNRPGQPQQGTPNSRQGTQQNGAPSRQGASGNPQQPGRPGQPQRPGQLPQSQPQQGQPQQGQPRQGQPGTQPQQGAPNRPGTQPGRPGLPQQLGQPGAPPRSGLQQGAPGLQRPGLQTRPAPQRLRPAPARGKEKKRY